MGKGQGATGDGRWAMESEIGNRKSPLPIAHCPLPISVNQLEAASTSDEVWNAAQRQMLAEGWFHGYLRMLWGKKILEWSAQPADALETMRTLMDRYSLDGRDPNSYASSAWVLGRYDRPWPERPIFGTVRCMASQSARRKLRMKGFLEQYGDPTSSTHGRAMRR
jgi:deoxyribodipyrimidine photo-lyase